MLILLWILSACAPGQQAIRPAPAPEEQPESSDSDYVGKTVAVFYFENDSLTARDEMDFLTVWLTERLIRRFSEIRTVRVVERNQLDKVLGELSLGSSELADSATALRLGKLMVADNVVFGNFTRTGNQLLIMSRVVDVESSRIVSSEVVSGSADDLDALSTDLMRALVDGLGVDIVREEVRKTGSRETLEVAKRFTDGLAREDRGDVEGALDAYQGVLKLDPKNRWARDRVRKLLDAGLRG